MAKGDKTTKAAKNLAKKQEGARKAEKKLSKELMKKVKSTAKKPGGTKAKPSRFGAMKKDGTRGVGGNEQ